MYRWVTISFVIVTASFIWGCRSNESSQEAKKPVEGGIQITGKLQGGDGTRVFLEEMGAREFTPIDTVKCDETGSFEIGFTADRTAFYVLRYGTSRRVTLLIEPGEKVEFSGSVQDDAPYAVKGSRGSELLQELSEEHQKALKALGKIARRNMEMMSDPDYASLKLDLDRKFDSVTTAFHDYSLRFIKTHPESLVVLVALYNLYGEGLPVFHPKEDLEVYRYADSALNERYSGFEAVDLLHAQVAEATAALADDGHLHSVKKGEIAPDFVSSRPDGSQLALSDLRGNYVLVAFWAGWSSVSREENRILKQAYSSYREQPFRIVQVSLDASKKEWTDAISEDGLAWDQVSDLLRWDSPVANLYQVEKIPSNVLVDPSGKVVAKDLLGEELLEKLKSLFNP